MNNKFKVCHVTSVHSSRDPRIFIKECISLANSGYEVYLVAKGDSRDEAGVHVVGIGKEPTNRLKRMTRFSKKAIQTSLALDCDIYHLHDPELLPYSKMLKKHGKIVIFDSHENTLEQMEDKEWIPVPIRMLVSSAYKKFAIRTFRKLDCLISVTPHIVSQLKEINSNTWMITNYPIITNSNSIEGIERSGICFTGLIEPEWGHELVVESLNKLENVKYTLCGRADEKYLDTLKSLPEWSQVDYLGLVSIDKAKAIQNSSLVGVAMLRPSKNTGGNEGTLGNTKIFEYMLAGLPIVCTNFNLWKEIVGNYKCGICIPYCDEKLFVNAISYLLSHPEEAYQMGMNGKKAVEEEFNWTTQERKLIELYSSLVEKDI